MLSELHLLQFCQICYGNYMMGDDEGQRPNGVCYNCWYNHVKTSLMKITYKLGSNIMGISEGNPNIQVTFALNSLKPTHMIELEEWLFKKYTTFTTDINKCPSQTCDFVYMLENCRLGFRANYNCPKCQMPLMPNTTFSFRSIFGSLYFLIFAGMCPKCDIPIEKISGCPHMTCPCGHQFCWYCSKDHRHTANNLYNVHNVQECGMILLSKLMLVGFCMLGLILTACGYEGFKKFTTFISFVLSMSLRVLLIDLVVFIEIYILGIVYRSRFNLYSKHRNKLINYVLGMLILDVLILLGLHYLDQLTLIISLVALQLFVAGSICITVVVFMHSINTWFNYIQ